MPYTFPTLSTTPRIEPWEEGVAKDPTVRTDFENGFRQTYPAFARIPDKWHINYRCPTADKASIRTFEKTVKVGSAQFTWTNPVDSAQHEVRFLAPVKYKMHLNQNYWAVDFDLEEV